MSKVQGDARNRRGEASQSLSTSSTPTSAPTRPARITCNFPLDGFLMAFVIPPSRMRLLPCESRRRRLSQVVIAGAGFPIA